MWHGSPIKKDLLSLLFSFLAILCFQKYSEDKRTKSLIFIFFFGTLAYWSKNTAIALPPILICWSLLQNRKIDIKLWVMCLTVFFGSALSNNERGKNRGNVCRTSRGKPMGNATHNLRCVGKISSYTSLNTKTLCSLCGRRTQFFHIVW